MSREISGYVGKIVSPTDIAESAIDPVDEIVAEGSHIIALNQSPVPTRLDRVLRSISGDRLGYSIELDDSEAMILVDELEATQHEKGDKVTLEVEKVNVWQKGVYRLDQSDNNRTTHQ